MYWCTILNVKDEQTIINKQLLTTKKNVMNKIWKKIQINKLKWKRIENSKGKKTC